MLAFFLPFCQEKTGWHDCGRARGNQCNNHYIIIKPLLMSVNIKPLADRVLIEPSAAETQTASGIIIPDTAKEKPQRGTVVAVGNGTKDHEMTVKVGDTVLYGKYAGTELKLDNKDYLIMKENDILAIV